VGGLNRNLNFNELNTIKTHWHREIDLEQYLVDMFHSFVFWQMVTKRYDAKFK
jgi:hypothetical protein